MSHVLHRIISHCRFQRHTYAGVTVPHSLLAAESEDTTDIDRLPA